jgi:hypothetical protein
VKAPSVDMTPDGPKVWVCSICARKAKQPGVEQLGHRARLWCDTCPRCDSPGAGMLLVPATPEEVERSKVNQ